MNIEVTKNGNMAQVVLTGSLDTVAATQAMEQFQNIVQGEVTNVTIDCTGVDYIASSGLRLLLMVRKACKAAGGETTLTGVQTNVMEVLTITHFDKLFNII